MLQMYKGAINSPETIITNNISNTDTLIYVQDETKVPTDLPNLMVLGTGISAETIKVLSISGLAITVERAFQGTAKTWNAGTTIARNFTEYDYEALKNNVEELTDNQGDLTLLATVEQSNLVGAINENTTQLAQIGTDLDAHLTDLITDANGVHGLKIETGIWTPILIGSTVAGTNTYSKQVGSYYKVGKQVTISFIIQMSAKDATMSGQASIGGLPFTIKSGVRFGASFSNYREIIFMSGRTQLMGYGFSNRIVLTNSGDSVTSSTYALTQAEIKDTTLVEGSLTYYTD